MKVTLHMAVSIDGFVATKIEDKIGEDRGQGRSGSDMLRRKHITRAAEGAH